MYYKKEKRKDIDLCNICGKSKRLTWDHVPPKCCNNRYAIKTNSWMEGIPEESSYTKKYQNGIKFRSLCDECNNKVLGANYDKVLEEFADQLAIIMQTSIALPPVVKVSIKINRLCRANVLQNTIQLKSIHGKYEKSSKYGRPFCFGKRPF